MLLFWSLPMQLFAHHRPEIIIPIRHTNKSRYDPEIKNFPIYDNEYPKHAYMHLGSSTVQIYYGSGMFNFRISKFYATPFETPGETYWEYDLINSSGKKYILRVMRKHKGGHWRTNAMLQTIDKFPTRNSMAWGYYSSKRIIN